MPLLSPPPKFHVSKADGTPAVGWSLYTYTNGTSTPKATYQDFGLGSANTNPIVLDARGEATIFLNGSYKFVLKDDVGATIWTVDEIRDLTTDQTFTNVILAGTLTINSTSVTWAGNPTHSGNHTFSGNVTVNGNTVIGNASTDTLTVASNTVTWSNNPNHSGNHSFTGTINAATLVATALATANGSVTNSTWTPTLTNVANVASVVDNPACLYERNGSNVSFSGQFTITMTAAAPTLTVLGISLPVASNFTQVYHANGGIASVTVSGENTSGTISGDTTNDRMQAEFYALTTASRTFKFWGSYRIL